MCAYKGDMVMVEIIIGLIKFVVELLNDMGVSSIHKFFTLLLICSLSLNVYLIEKVISLAETIYIYEEDKAKAKVVVETIVPKKPTKIKKSE
jgi:hypothetical protein